MDVPASVEEVRVAPVRRFEAGIADVQHPTSEGSDYGNVCTMDGLANMEVGAVGCPKRIRQNGWLSIRKIGWNAEYGPGGSRLIVWD